ncbi:hypothetical protein ACXYTP_21235 [Tsukamurella ocularis]|uniref:hypothetical protein n=1 Tax=Tsukamurella ocularis TaxID=1970234 RepID=UPI0039F0ABEE
MRMLKATRSVVVVSALVAALMLGGCAKAGADTTCKDFLAMSEADQSEQVQKMYKDKHGEDPAAGAATALRAEAVAYCSTAGKEDTKIKEVPIS